MNNSDFKDLKVWQKAMELTTKVYSLCKTLPVDERYALSDQIRRAVISIPSNISEGHGRSSNKEFIHYLFIARGSLFELETQIEICIRLNFLLRHECAEVESLIVEIGKMINSLISYRQKLLQQSTPKT